MKIRKATKRDLKQIIALYIDYLISQRKFAKWLGNSKNKIDNKEVKRAIEKSISKAGHHIFLIAEKDNEREYSDSKSSRNYTLIYILIFVSLFVFLTIFLVKDNRDLFIEILKVVAIFAGGFGSGYGIKSYRDNKKE